MGHHGAAGAEVMRMRFVRSGRRKVWWVAAVAVAITLVGHALLMAGGGHPALAAHPTSTSTSAAAPATAEHPAMAAPRAPQAAHHGTAAARSMRHGTIDPSDDATTGFETVDDLPPAGDGPTGDETADCDGMLVLAWPQAQPAPSAGSTSDVVSAAVDPVVLPVAESRVVASRLDPTDPPGTRRALLQIYRI